ncbi:MAG: hypothetical protein HC840_10970 [Leptolyngbyaceae cyanobacterium RM2_2_4]|nr:hypothetical protein [Leptolyngbyaceae cyanobacterium SL_5_9]NJO49867.1 hypothetical protein [Leptolyngbyaceae cyanobacterium RM2_2_4]
MTWRGSTTPKDRFFACLPYFLPLVDGLAFGEYFFRQFPALRVILLPLSPILIAYDTIDRALFGFGGLIVFFALFLLVVRNESINHFIRFNAMQAILLDIILILCGFILGLFGSGLGGGLIVETIFNVIFLGMVAVIVYSVVQSVMGRYAEIPTLSDAVYMQVR